MLHIHYLSLLQDSDALFKQRVLELDKSPCSIWQLSLSCSAKWKPDLSWSPFTPCKTAHWGCLSLLQILRSLFLVSLHCRGESACFIALYVQKAHQGWKDESCSSLQKPQVPWICWGYCWFLIPPVACSGALNGTCSERTKRLSANNLVCS